MNNLLIIISVVLVAAGITQFVRILELTSGMRGDDNKVTDRDNSIQGSLMMLWMIVMMGSFFWMLNKWGGEMLPVPASEHGVQIDNLMNITMGIILVVFFITQPILFYFAWRYRGRKGNKAFFYAHNNKLELIWTVVPAVVLTVLIAYGLNTWGNITNADTSNSTVVEFYARQFDWTARMAGDDNVLGDSDVRNIEGANIVGVDMDDPASADDMLVRGEIHIPVGQPYLFKFRSQDVIHSAYFPHFRMQMNCVPGMNTQFAFTPTKTTSEMRNITGNPEFDYVLLCNKICGAAHYNMQMKVVVESEADYQAWVSEQTAMKDM
jgi:cytochrome c oxidase subunit 2